MSDRFQKSSSLVAAYDDIVRNRAVLTVGTEKEFWIFVNGQEDWRKRFLELENNAAAMSSRLKEAEQEKASLQTKLKHARNQIDVEITKRQRAEHDRDSFERQILLVRELLNDKSNATVLNVKDREKLAFLSADFPSTLYERSPRRGNLDTIEESGSLLSPSDISYDKTEEDLDTPLRGRHKRPSAPPMEDDEDLTPPGKRSRHAHKKRHRRSKSADVAAVELQTRESSVAVPDPLPGRNRRNSSPMSRILARTSSHDEVYGSGYKNSLKKRHCDSPSIETSTPDLKRYNSGNSLTKPHLFDSKTFYKQEMCFVCSKKIKFGKSGLKCKACFSVCHPECRDTAPLPCSVGAITPAGPKGVSGYIGDYAPSEPPMVPAIVIHCVKEVEARGLSEVGIYRVSGYEKDVRELKEKFLKGRGTPNLVTVGDINVICSCLKDFLRGLKEPLVTFNLWHDFVRAAEKSDRHESQADMYQAISQLPQPNRDTIAFLALHLQRVAECEACKMPASNLAKVFGPTVIGYSSPDPDAMRMISETGKQNMVMEKLLSIPTDYWATFVGCSTGNNQLPGSATVNVQEAEQYRYLPKYDFNSRNTPATTPLLGPIHGDQQENGGQWFGSRFGSSIKKPTTPFFQSPSLK